MVIFLRDPKKTSCYYMLICQSAISSCCWFEVAAEINLQNLHPCRKSFSKGSESLGKVNVVETRLLSIKGLHLCNLKST